MKRRLSRNVAEIQRSMGPQRRRYPPLIVCAVLLQTLFTEASFAADWWVDAQAKFPGTGSEAAPYLELSEALNSASGGDTIHLKAGAYEGISFRSDAGSALFENDYVTIRPAEGVTNNTDVSIGHIRLARGWPSEDFNAYLRIENVVLSDGAYLERATHVQFIGCLIEREGPWTGSSENIEKTALKMRNAHNVLVENCEITRTGTGLILSGTDIVARGNHIHDITHDGIRITSVQNGLIENNRIHNLDDGIEDGDADWNRHCDALHLYIPGPANPGTENRNVTIRGNLVYNCESQGLQAQGYYDSDARNTDIVIENNVFGPTRANPVNIVEKTNFIFRHNTLIPGSTTFASAALEGSGYERLVTCSNNTLRVPGDAGDFAVYNNFLIMGFKRTPGCYADFNAYYAPTANDVLARNEIVAPNPLFVDAEGIDFRLQAGSDLINAGTSVYATGPTLPPDPHGVSRDARPDIGAFEFPGLSPRSESPPPRHGPPAYRFVDDFLDANIEADPSLAGKHQLGLAWFSPTNDPPMQIASRSSIFSHCLSAIAIGRFYTGKAWAMTKAGDDWTDIEIRIGATSAQGLISGGFLVRANPQLEGYYIDLVDGSIALRERGLDGKIVETPLAELETYLLPPGGARYFLISVSDTEVGVSISVRSEDDSIPVLTGIDPNRTFPKGRFAIYNESDAAYKRIDYGEVQIEIPAPRSTYQGFIVEYFNEAEAEDPGISGPDADPDHDGKTNFSEFALGSHPLEAESAPLIQPGFNHENFVLNFRRLAQPHSVHYRLLTSVDMEHWTEAKLPLLADPPPADEIYENVSVEFPQSPEHSVSFIRLAVSDE